MEIKVHKRDDTIERLEKLIIELQLKVDGTRQENSVLQQTKEMLVVDISKLEQSRMQQKHEHLLTMDRFE